MLFKGSAVSSGAKFITFEGIEGCGKSTQVDRTARLLTQAGIAHLLTAEPGGTSLGESVRRLTLYDRETRPIPEAELLLFCAARAQHVKQVVLSALNRGLWVLCDRFSDATVAYQGYGRGLELDLIHRLNRFSSFSLIPDITILLDVPVEVGLQRARKVTARTAGLPAGDLIESENLAFHHRVRDGYHELAKMEPERFRIIDGMQDVESVQAAVRACIDLKR